MAKTLHFFLAFVFASPPLCNLLSAGELDTETSKPGRPNVLLIVADDLGFSDLGCYGGDIETPCLDRLATQSSRWVNFRVNPMCVVTRTSLMTGQEHSQSDGYRRSWPLPVAMRQSGYATKAIGKWHQPQHPMDHGFDEFYGFLGGQINNFTGSNAILDDRAPAVIDDQWFSSNAFTDEAIEHIERCVNDREPFFTYLAFNAPHTPLNIDKASVKKYDGRFDQGWSVLRQKRFAKLKALGVIDDKYIDTPPNGDVRPWDDLTEQAKQVEALRMETYAAVVDNVDENVGRLLDRLDSLDVREQTIVIFLSDNGGDYSNGDIRVDPKVKPWNRDSLPFMSNGWAYLKCAPFRFYKSSVYEGGVRVPMILRWPGGSKLPAGSIQRSQCHVTDLYETLIDIAQANAPDDQPGGLQTQRIGTTLRPILSGELVDGLKDRHPIPWAFSNTSRGYLDYPLKLVSVNEGPWQLYDLEADPCETHDIALEYPAIKDRLSNAWNDFAEHRTTMPLDWRRPPVQDQHGWGYHRITKIWPFVTSQPRCSEVDVAIDTDLSFTFHTKVLRNPLGNMVRLYRVDNPDKPVWTSPAIDSTNPSSNIVRFDDLPTLAPSSAYFLLCDEGWAHVGKRPMKGLNDGAFWFRFRTGP